MTGSGSAEPTICHSARNCYAIVVSGFYPMDVEWWTPSPITEDFTHLMAVGRESHKLASQLKSEARLSRARAAMTSAVTVGWGKMLPRTTHDCLVFSADNFPRHGDLSDQTSSPSAEVEVTHEIPKPMLASTFEDRNFALVVCTRAKYNVNQSESLRGLDQRTSLTRA